MFAVQIVIRGWVGPALRAAVPDLAAEVVPRHDVVVLGSERISDLVRVLAVLEQREVVFDRIVHSAGPPGGGTRGG